MELWLLVGRWLTIMDWWRLRRTCKRLAALLPSRRLPSTAPVWRNDESLSLFMNEVMIPELRREGRTINTFEELKLRACGFHAFLSSPCEELWLCKPGHAFEPHKCNGERARVRYLRCAGCDGRIFEWCALCDACALRKKERLARKRALDHTLGIEHYFVKKR